MTTTYLGFRCRNNSPDRRGADVPQIDCPGLIGGPSTDTLLSHDFAKGPFRCVGRCARCRTWHEITIPSMVDLPIVSRFPKGAKLNVVDPETYFGGVRYGKRQEETKEEEVSANG